jgi:hypothetical protein
VNRHGALAAMLTGFGVTIAWKLGRGAAQDPASFALVPWGVLVLTALLLLAGQLTRAMDAGGRFAVVTTAVVTLGAWLLVRQWGLDQLLRAGAGVRAGGAGRARGEPARAGARVAATSGLGSVGTPRPSIGQGRGAARDEEEDYGSTMTRALLLSPAASSETKYTPGATRCSRSVLAAHMTVWLPAPASPSNSVLTSAPLAS